MNPVAVAPSQSDVLLHGLDQQNVGQWKPIKDIKDPFVQEMARFGVMEFNREKGEDLIFKRVESGETMVVVAGKKYRLLVVAEKPGDNGIYFYSVVVLDKPGEQSWKFVSIIELVKNN